MIVHLQFLLVKVISKKLIQIISLLLKILLQLQKILKIRNVQVK